MATHQKSETKWALLAAVVALATLSACTSYAAKMKSLDAQYASGRIGHEEYNRRRENVIAREQNRLARIQREPMRTHRNVILPSAANDEMTGVDRRVPKHHAYQPSYHPVYVPVYRPVQGQGVQLSPGFRDEYEVERVDRLGTPPGTSVYRVRQR